MISEPNSLNWFTLERGQTKKVRLLYRKLADSGLYQVLLGFEISFIVAYPKIKFVPIKSPIKLKCQKFSVQLEGLLRNRNRLVKNALKLRLLKLRLSLENNVDG